MGASPTPTIYEWSGSPGCVEEGRSLAVALDEGTREYFFHSPAKSYWGEFIAALVQNSIRWVCRDAFHGKNCKWE
jgi:hypothetical protein